MGTLIGVWPRLCYWRSDLGALQGLGVRNRQFGMLITFSLVGGDIFAASHR